MKCSAPRCECEARWRVHLVLRSPESEVRLSIPVAVCSRHRRAIRRTVLGRVLPEVLRILARKGIGAASRFVQIRFTEME